MVKERVQTMIGVSDKRLRMEHLEGPVGVRAWIHELGWEAEVSLSEGIAQTYTWMEKQVAWVSEAER